MLGILYLQKGKYFPDVIFSLLKIHTQHSKKPSPNGEGFLCFFRLYAAAAENHFLFGL